MPKSPEVLKSKEELLGEITSHFQGFTDDECRKRLLSFWQNIIERLPDLDCDKEKEEELLPCCFCNHTPQYWRNEVDTERKVSCLNASCLNVSTMWFGGEVVNAKRRAASEWNQQMSKVVRK